MKNTNPLLAWLSENWLRITAKSPKFFQVWQVISGIIVAITGIPDFLSMFHIELPTVWAPQVNHIVAIASTVALIMSSLPSKPEPIGTDNNGTVIKTSNESKLPFTAAEERKELLK